MKGSCPNFSSPRDANAAQPFNQLRRCLVCEGKNEDSTGLNGQLLNQVSDAMNESCCLAGAGARNNVYESLFSCRRI